MKTKELVSEIDVACPSPCGMGKRRRPDSELTPEELERRNYQRTLQKQALDARARGETFEPTRRLTFPKRKPLEARKEQARIEKRKAENAARRRAVQKSVKKQRADAPDVVVVPIFWKGEAKQMARVLSACKDIEAVLESTKWQVLLDAGHKYTPGQKFAHWEHKGVKLRVEVGPREAEKGCCTLARTFKPGEPAKRITRVQVNANLPQELEKIEALVDTEDDAQQASADAEGDDSELEDAAVALPQRSAGGGKRLGGDDLDDDYAPLMQANSAASGDDEADEGGFQRKGDAKRAKPAKSKEAGAARPSSEKRAKVVNF
jgi:hypothetical protein